MYDLYPLPTATDGMQKQKLLCAQNEDASLFHSLNVSNSSFYRPFLPNHSIFPVHLNHHLPMPNLHNNFFTDDRLVTGVGLSAALYSLPPTAQGHDTIAFRVQI